MREVTAMSLYLEQYLKPAKFFFGKDWVSQDIDIKIFVVIIQILVNRRIIAEGERSGIDSETDQRQFKI